MAIDLTNFGDIFSLAATLNIAFVAVDYVHSYTNILAERFFNIQKKISDDIKSLKQSITDETTINNIAPVVIDGKSTISLIEEAKLARENIDKELDNTEKKLTEDVKVKCESKTISFISLYLALYSIVGLLLIGIFQKWGSYLEDFWIVFTIFSTIIVIIGWSVKCPEKKIFKFCSLKHCIYSISVVFLFSIIVSKIINSNIYIPDYISDYFYIYSEIFTLSNFMVYIFIIKNKSKLIDKQINNEISRLKISCDKLEEKVSRLTNLMYISNNLKSDKIE